MESNRGSTPRWTEGLPLYVLLCLIVAGATAIGLSWWVAPLLVALFVTAIPRRKA